ncbi:MAG TPA: hypothetical protein PKJ95_07745, partial [Atribacterota bacterium]|nr:hypothetical protein [Atribacterota bacterium]
MRMVKLGRKNNKIFQKYFLQRLLFIFLIIIIMTVILSINFVPGKILLKAGEVAPRNISATETIEFVDKKATEKLKEEAAKSTHEVYNLNLASIENTERELLDFFSDIRKLRNQYNLLIEERQIENTLNPDELINNSSINNGLGIVADKYLFDRGNPLLINLVKLDRSSLEEIEENVSLSLKKIMQQGVKENDIELAKKQIVREISELSTSPYTAILAGEVGENFLKPSLFLDEETTLSKKQEAVAAVR